MNKYTENQLNSLLGCLLIHENDEIIIYKIDNISSISLNNLRNDIAYNDLLSKLSDVLIYLENESDELVSLEAYFSHHGIK